MKLNIFIAFSDSQNIIAMQKLISKIKSILAKEKYSVKIKRVPLNGFFFAEPLIKIENESSYIKFYKNIDITNIKEILNDYILKKFKHENLFAEDEINIYFSTKKIILNPFGENIRSILNYKASGGFKSLNKLVKNANRLELIEIIKNSKLRERTLQGEYFYKKIIKFHNYNKRKKYIVCNLYQSFSSYNNNVLVDSVPFKILEGIIITGFITNSSHGIIFIDFRNKKEIETIQNAIFELKESGLLGKHILNTDFSFDIHIQKGFGSLLLTNETIQKNIIENEIEHIRLSDREEMLLTNGETLANLPYIFNYGVKKFQNFGLKNGYGTKLITLIGKTNRNGVFEIEFGKSIRAIINNFGKGIKENGKIKAIQIGGISGMIIPYSLTKTIYDFDYLAQIGASVGDGSLLVFDENNCMVAYLKYIVKIFLNESCGKCTIGRIGLKRIHETLVKISSGKAEMDDLRILKKLSEHLKETALCEFGRNAAIPILSTLKYFESDFIDHIKKKRCSAKQCSELIKYQINNKKCSQCDKCIELCPTNAIEKNKKNNTYIINAEKCIKCDLCYQVCDNGSIEKISKGI